ncbi:MAG TPA: nucleotide pyrophosphatase/phosphodiesterase family protein, partial [Microvirga sp.]|nr:nucleotide pyrophosphatase/phosphodiesterase family protein [Microvirga sp.]
MRATLVLLVVGLTPGHLGRNTPNLSRLAEAGAMRPLSTIIPAVTCSVQATFMTGSMPRDHGVVANGWLFRDLMEVWLWRQSNRLVAGEKIWEAGKRRDPTFTCANLFWWYNMAASHDIGVTPRPVYKADGRKLPDCYTRPAELRAELTAKLGPFPLFQFWGPGTAISSSRWIAEAAKHVVATRAPTLTLVYLPHLDYDFQRYGPDEGHPRVAASLREVDQVAGDLIGAAAAAGLRVVVLSEYGILPVDTPVHINRALREAGFLAIREEDGAELLDPVASRAFAVADHQVAHIYVAEPDLVEAVRRVVSALPGVAEVWGDADKQAHGLDHPRSGELVALSDRNAWFTYYYWLDEARAPDFARTVEIHRKPGYDPVELFIDPAIRFPKLALGARLLSRRLGFRTLMDVIPLDAGLVKGSHGRLAACPEDGPLVISSEAHLLPDEAVTATDVMPLILDH